MSISDPIADLLTRVRNAIMVHRASVMAPYSKLKNNVLEVLKREGYIKNFEVVEEGNKKNIIVYLKYADNGSPVISELHRISKPGCRIYSNVDEIKPILNGIGVSIVTTPQGVLSDRECREKKVGGEVLCEVW
jgi:small subunit ribosomal protein S8